MDSIEFESKRETEEMLRVIEKYVEAYPKEKNNEILKDFYDELYVIDMTW